ncbi:MAG: PucR family transcriptional regulator [Acholeplasmataceae bacterium]
MYYYIYFNQMKLNELLIDQIKSTINRFFGKIVRIIPDNRYLMIVVKDHFDYAKIYEYFENFITDNLVNVVVYISKKFDNQDELYDEYQVIRDLMNGNHFINKKNVYYFRELLNDSLMVNNTKIIKKYILGKFYNQNETYLMLKTFFNNNLNVLKTARDLTMHRNTVIYRLDSFNEETNLDPREFNDAFIIKLLIDF